MGTLGLSWDDRAGLAGVHRDRFFTGLHSRSRARVGLGSVPGTAGSGSPTCPGRRAAGFAIGLALRFGPVLSDTLLLEHDLRGSEEDSEARTLARAQTLTVLEELDSSRKEQVLRFLIEAELVQRVAERVPLPVLGLHCAPHCRV